MSYARGSNSPRYRADHEHVSATVVMTQWQKEHQLFLLQDETGWMLPNRSVVKTPKIEGNHPLIVEQLLETLQVFHKVSKYYFVKERQFHDTQDNSISPNFLYLALVKKSATPINTLSVDTKRCTAWAWVGLAEALRGSLRVYSRWDNADISSEGLWLSQSDINALEAASNTLRELYR